MITEDGYKIEVLQEDYLLVAKIYCPCHNHSNICGTASTSIETPEDLNNEIQTALNLLREHGCGIAHEQPEETPEVTIPEITVT